jgi:hypothetical protein
LEPERGTARLIVMARLVRVILTMALVVAMAACAARSGGANGSTPSTVDGASTATPGCGSHLVVDESASGSTVCVVRGSELIVMLHAGTGGDWSTPRVAGSALGPGAGIPTPNRSVGWSFQAVAAGTAQISSSRPACPTAGAGGAQCRSLVAFELRVEVR